MATLLLLRHASAESRDDDEARRLTPEGQREACFMGRLLSERGLRPARVLCSTAVRARETVAGLLDGADGALSGVPIRHDQRLYLASPTRLRECVGEVDSGVACVLVVAHNPGLYELTRALVGDSDVGRKALSCGFPPASLAAITLAGGYGHLTAEQASLIEVALPA